MFEFDWTWLIMAFCGGVFGAAVGALPSFILCGVGALLGGVYGMATGGGPNELDIWVTWGPLVGPQTAFAGGAVAAVYANRFLASTVPTAEFTPGSEAGQLIAWASERDHLQIQSLIDQITKEPDPEKAPTAVVLCSSALDPTKK